MTSLTSSTRRATLVGTAMLAIGMLVVGPAVTAAADPGENRAAIALAADPQLQVPGFDIKNFQHPTTQKPSVLWFWDRPQSDAQIDTKLESIKAAGFSSTTIFRWFGDVPEAFFSEAWFHRVGHLLEKSRELGLTVWLDNDNKFPSGSAGGFIVNGGTVGGTSYAPRPDLRVKTLGTGGVAVRNGGGPIALKQLFGSSIQLENGQVVADSASAPGITLLRDGASWSNYAVDADFTIDRATAGFMVRSPNTRNGYLVDVRSDGKVDVWNQSDGSFRLVRLGSTNRPAWSPTAAHHITIRLDGPQIGITLDGVADPGLSDTSHPVGGVGMRVAGNQRWRLNELTVKRLPAGPVLYSNDFSDEGSVADFDAHTTPLENVVAVSARPADGEGATDPSKVLDITSDFTGAGTWNAPEGRWRIEAYRYSFRGGDRTSYADTMDVEAQNLYTKIIFDEYYKRFGEYFGSTLVGFADDEPEVGRHGDDLPPWTPALSTRLADAGLNQAAVLASVFNDLGTKGATLRSQYYRAASDQWVDAYWKTKFDWAKAHGVQVLSNPLYDEYGPAGRVHESGNLLSMHQWAQMPGTDLIGDQVKNGMVRNLPYEPASVAHQLGRPLVYDELMGATGWQTSIADVRQGTAMSAVRGINKALFHATFDAPATAPFPPTFSDKNVWWPYVPQLNEWAGRLMEFGRHTTAAQTAVLQMQRAAEAAQLGDQSAVDTPFFAAEHSLEDAQVDFDLLDEGALSNDPQILAHASVTSDGHLNVGAMSYSAVVVPQAPLISLEAAHTLLAFAKEGGQVVFAGVVPTHELSGRDAELASTIGAIRTAGGDHVIDTKSASGAGAAAATLGRSAVTLAQPNTTVRVLRFQEGKTAGYMLLNEGSATVATDFTFPYAGVPVKWDPDTGDVTTATTYTTATDTTVVPLTLQPNVPVGITISPEKGTAPHALRTSGVGTVERVITDSAALRVAVRSAAAGATLVTATDGVTERTGVIETPKLPETVALDGKWRMQLDNGSPAVTRPLKSWGDIAPTFSGDATYTRSFSLTQEQLKNGWTLNLGQIANAAEMVVNGKRLEDLSHAPYTVDVGKDLVAGENTIKITVTNTDANSRGDNRSSGLLGPVALIPYSVTEGELVESGIKITAATAVMDASGEFGAVSLTIANTGDKEASVTAGASGAGWVTGAHAPVTVPAGSSDIVTGWTVPTAFIVDGTVSLTATAAVDGQVVAATPVVLDSRFPTPPTTFGDHIDLGDSASETAHNLQKSATSGSNVEAGQTRRYAGYRVPDAWYEVDLAVKPGKGFLLQGLETYNTSPQVKSYHVLIDGKPVATRLNVRNLTQEGTAAYRLFVPAEYVTSDKVTVRFQSRGNPDFADPSLADVWAIPITTDTTAPTVTASIGSATPGEAGWLRGPATVTLTATDNRPGTVAAEYDAGKGWMSYSTPIAVAADGENVVHFRATDTAGNISADKTATVRIDTDAPRTSGKINDPYAPGVVVAPGTVTLTADDASSGVASTRYRLNGGAWVDGTNVPLNDVGKVLVEFSSTDVAGNSGDISSLQITVTQTPIQQATNLGSAFPYAVLAGAEVTSPNSTMWGDVGAGGEETITDTTSGGTVHDSGTSGDALTEISNAYTTLNALTPTGSLSSADLAGQVITAGVYRVAAYSMTAPVTFDAQGDPNAIFVMQSDGGLNTTAGVTVTLVNGANPAHIFWVTDGAATLGANSVFDGTIISHAAVTVGAGSSLTGRAFSVTAAVTLDHNTIGLTLTTLDWASGSQPTAGQPHP